jgi:diaminohydroxyphosphoribosylaminopyrimidine deaminase/5-amino-6-(5-phosphoribosylamino)uracil reductase
LKNVGADDQLWMKHALALARRGIGLVAPNPTVGCVLVKDQIVVGRGFTQLGGRPHAETIALGQAGANAAQSTAYVSLEPCSHYGKTGPCAQAMINAGVARVVVAVHDPNPLVSGRGIEMLRAAGIEVTEGVFERAATDLNQGFFTSMISGRPSFTLKVASSFDGKIALSNGNSKWITGNAARQFGHLLRARHDAILVGVNTVIADDPNLGCRLPGLEYTSPIKIILDRTLRVPPNAKILGQAKHMRTILVSEVDALPEIMEGTGVELITVQSVYDMNEVARALSGIGVTSVLVEGGGKVAVSFLKANLIDNLAHFTAGLAIGADGKSAIADLGLADIPNAPHFTLQKIRRLGADMLATYRKAG